MKCDDCGLGLLIKMARLRVSSASLRTNERSKALGLMSKHLDHYMERFDELRRTANAETTFTRKWRVTS